MNEFWITTLSILLVTLGVLAEFNLIRVFLSDWLEGRREERRRTFRPESVFPKYSFVPRARSVGAWGLSCGSLATLILPPSVAVGVSRAEETATQPLAPESANVTLPSINVERTAGSSVPATGLSDTNKSPFSLQLNLDFTNAYFYRGIFQQDKGLIVQPAAKLTVNIYEQADLKIDALLGTWNSFGPNSGTQTSDLVRDWYESDLMGGFVLTKGKVSLTTTYTFLTSPSDAYETVQELGFTLAYDDTDLLEKFALHPYALLAIETGADASDGGNSNPGTYLELGIAPGFSFDVGKTPVAITFPASIGLSLHDYYQNAAGDDDTVGFAQVGVRVSVPLPLGDRYGKWTLNAGVSGLFIGDHAGDFNGGKRQEVIGTIGIQLNF